MAADVLKLNRDKTDELLVIGHKVNPPIKGIHVAGEYIEVSNNARNIRVIFDSHVNLEKHVMNTCKTAFYHLRNIAKIRNCLSQDNAEKLVHAFISSKVDFCNALQYGLPQSVIDKLQHLESVEFRDNVMAFLPQGQRKLSVIMKCPYYAGIRKAGLDCTELHSRMFKIL